MDSIFADKKSFKAEFKARAVRRYARDIDHLSNVSSQSIYMNLAL